MAIVGPWAIAVYRSKVDWGVVPVPTADGRPAERIHTFSDEKSIGMFTACKNRGTAWDVLKFATSQEQDGKLLEATGQMPMRRTCRPPTRRTSPRTRLQALRRRRPPAPSRCPNVPNSIEIWQAFRDAYSKSVIFGKVDRTARCRTAAARSTSSLGRQ